MSVDETDLTPLDLASVQADDALLDHVGAGFQAGMTPLGEVLAEWRGRIVEDGAR